MIVHAISMYSNLQRLYSHIKSYLWTGSNNHGIYQGAESLEKNKYIDSEKSSLSYNLYLIILLLLYCNLSKLCETSVYLGICDRVVCVFNYQFISL